MLPSTSDNLIVERGKVSFADDDFAALRKLSLDERGRLIESACRTAMEILAGRRRSGLADELPAPWPASTVEFLRRHAHACARAQRAD